MQKPVGEWMRSLLMGLRGIFGANREFSDSVVHSPKTVGCLTMEYADRRSTLRQTPHWRVILPVGQSLVKVILVPSRRVLQTGIIPL